MQRYFRFLLIFCLLLFGTSHVYSSTIYKYDVDIPKDLSHFNVKLCFTSPPPEYLYIANEDKASHFSNIYHIKQNKPYRLIPSQQYLDLAEVKQGDCIRYTAVFNGNITHPWFKSRQSTKDQILVELSQWLWQPSENSEVAVTIDFHLPEGFEVSAPGKLLRSSQNTRIYQFRRRSADWEGRIAVGRFEKVMRNNNGSRVEIAMLQGRQQFNRNKILLWIDSNLNALRQIYGQLPVKYLQLLVIPVGADREPVPWGEVMRGGGDGLHVYIDQTRPMTEFVADWVLIHELAHLLHPSISGNGNWLSEGLASYYQNILRARVGVLTEAQAWEALNAGFERGLQGTLGDRTLAQVTEAMIRDRQFMRVYWSGAAISLLADTRLRMDSKNKLSFDIVLKKFAQCCLPADDEWTARELMKKFDELSNSKIFIELYDAHVDATHFPDLKNTYQQLGLKKETAHLRLLNAAPEIQVRRGIMQKK